jgi:Domain of unknown function (DUF6249)
MKTTFLSLLTCLLALNAFGQTPTPSPTPSFAATAAPTLAPAGMTTATPTPTATATATATPANSVTLTLSTSATPSADDAIDNMIEKKIRSHFDFSTSGHHSSSSSDHDDDSAWIAVPIVLISMIAIFGMPVLIVAVILYFSFSRNRAMHKTVRLMVEKGQPVPESLLNPPPVVRQRSDLRRGIKWILVGVGVMIFFGACNDWEGGAWSIGIIPFLIGAGYLIFWRLDLGEPRPPAVTYAPTTPVAPPPVPPSSPQV